MSQKNQQFKTGQRVKIWDSCSNGWTFAVVTGDKGHLVSVRTDSGVQGTVKKDIVYDAIFYEPEKGE